MFKQDIFRTVLSPFLIATLLHGPSTYYTSLPHFPCYYGITSPPEIGFHDRSLHSLPSPSFPPFLGKGIKGQTWEVKVFTEGGTK